ncbi:hypothetical protein ACHAWF_009660 [Thalassiosira exigua]
MTMHHGMAMASSPTALARNGNKMRSLLGIGPQARASVSWPNFGARPSSEPLRHQSVAVAAESTNVAYGPPRPQRRRLSFRATGPGRHQEAFRPGQKIVINPGGGDGTKANPSRKDRRSAPRPFVDRVRLRATGGSGGAGCIAHHQLGTYKRRPCGGHGGRGGNVYLVTDPGLSTLKMDKHHYAGGEGGRGGASGMNGKGGRDRYIRVPCGVVVRRVLGWEEVEEVEEMYAEDLEEGDPADVGEGGTDDNQSLGIDGSIAEAADDSDSTHATNNALEISSDDHERHHEPSVIPANEYVDSEQRDFGEIDIDDVSKEEEVEEEEIDEEEEVDEEEFDEETLMSTLSKRQRKNVKRPDGLPLDYDEVVDTGIRSQDGMYYWNSPEVDDDENDFASTAYGDSQTSATRKTAFVADLDKLHTSLLVAEGGKSGVGNIAFASRMHTFGLDAKAAKKAVPGRGECTHLELELKLIADVGLVGFPNAGKSSLLSAMSRARPKIASYPFTTLTPLQGTIQYRDGHSIVMADIPGLIDGAAQGRGRGAEFLRHIERTKALVYMVDAAGVDGRDPVNDLRVLGEELREYGSSGIFRDDEVGGDEGEDGGEMRRRRMEIMNRPSLILANKMDLIPEGDVGLGRREELLFQLRNAAQEVGIVHEKGDILGISALVTGEGLRILSKRLRQLVNESE